MNKLSHQKWTLFFCVDYFRRVVEVVIINTCAIQSIPLKKDTEFLSDYFLSFCRFNFIRGDNGKSFVWYVPMNAYSLTDLCTSHGWVWVRLIYLIFISLQDKKSVLMIYHSKTRNDFIELLLVGNWARWSNHGIRGGQSHLLEKSVLARKEHNSFNLFQSRNRW